MSAKPKGELSPPWIESLLSEAEAAETRGAPALALAILQRAGQASRDPGIQRRLGLELLRAGRMAEAGEALRRALMHAPLDAEVRYALGLTLLALGRCREGAALAEARFEPPGPISHKPQGFPYPEWRGEALAGKRLAVFPELGLADQLLAARMAPGLQAAGTELILFCPPQLTRLFADSFPGAAVTPAAGTAQFENPDHWTMITSLLGLAAAAAPAAPPYLRAAAPRRRRAGFRTAFSAEGLPAEAAERLRDGLPGEVVELPAEAADLAETAGQMAGADLVVCADGAAAQLASALGRPTLALIPLRDAHWSFGLGPPAARWHPTVQLFRAAPQGGWDSALARLLTEAQAQAR